MKAQITQIIGYKILLLVCCLVMGSVETTQRTTNLPIVSKYKTFQANFVTILDMTIQSKKGKQPTLHRKKSLSRLTPQAQDFAKQLIEFIVEEASKPNSSAYVVQDRIRKNRDHLLGQRIILDADTVELLNELAPNKSDDSQFGAIARLLEDQEKDKSLSPDNKRTYQAIARKLWEFISEEAYQEKPSLQDLQTRIGAYKTTLQDIDKNALKFFDACNDQSNLDYYLKIGPLAVSARKYRVAQQASIAKIEALIASAKAYIQTHQLNITPSDARNVLPVAERSHPKHAGAKPKEPQLAAVVPAAPAPSIPSAPLQDNSQLQATGDKNPRPSFLQSMQQYTSAICIVMTVAYTALSCYKDLVMRGKLDLVQAPWMQNMMKYLLRLPVI